MIEPPILPAVPIPPNPIGIPEPVFLQPQEPVLQYTPVLLPFFSPDELTSPVLGLEGPPESSESSKEQSKQNKAAPVTVPDMPLMYRQIPEPVQSPVSQQPISQITKISLPGTNIEIPIPQKEILITAATTAATASVVSVAATMSVQRLAKRLKPLSDRLVAFVIKKFKKTKPSLSYGRQRLALRRHKRLP